MLSHGIFYRVLLSETLIAFEKNNIMRYWIATTFCIEFSLITHWKVLKETKMFCQGYVLYAELVEA